MRKERWVILIWAPLALLGVGGTLFAALNILSSTGGGGPSTGPGEGTVVVAALGLLLVSAIMAIALFQCRPRYFPSSWLTGLAIVNAIAVFLAVILAIQEADRQDIIIHLKDRDGHPVAGVAVYRENTGTPTYSDTKGAVTVRSQMRHDTQARFSKAGYRDLLLTLTAQSSRYDNEREAIVGTWDTKMIARGKIAMGNPLKLALYLPAIADGPHPQTRRQALYSKLAVGEQDARYLDITTGKFSRGEPADLEFDLPLASDSDLKDPQLHIRGVGGMQILSSDAEVSFSEPLPAYESFFQAAPATGYLSEVTIKFKSGSAPIRVYIRSQDGVLFGRLDIEAQILFSSRTVYYSGTMTTNAAGSRWLE